MCWACRSEMVDTWYSFVNPRVPKAKGNKLSLIPPHPSLLLSLSSLLCYFLSPSLYSFVLSLHIFLSLSCYLSLMPSSDVPLRDMLWMNALKAGTRMRWMEMLSAEESHVDPSALIIVRTPADLEAMVPLVSIYADILASPPSTVNSCLLYTSPSPRD